MSAWSDRAAARLMADVAKDVPQQQEQPSPCGSDVGGCSSDDTACNPAELVRDMFARIEGEAHAHEEDLRRRVVVRSCIERLGFPECMGAAARGPAHCTCELPDGEHDEAVLAAWAHFFERGGKACRDCAYRKGSPELDSGQALRILDDERSAFVCHQGMPIDARGCEPELGNYMPDDAHRYPSCPGWVAARLARLYRRDRSHDQEPNDQRPEVEP